MDEKTIESLEQFFQMTSQDLELQSKLKAASDREAYISLVVELGKEKGYSFTYEQVATALDAAESEAENHRNELSREELDAVAGGRLNPLATKIGCSCFSSKPAPSPHSGCILTFRFPAPPR